MCFQMALYPMLDHRSATASAHEILDVGIWDRAANLEAWGLYLGGNGADAYASPALADDVHGLPPTFVDVGGIDLLRDEAIDFVGRLAAAGVTTEFHLHPGAYHGSELFAPEAGLSKRIWATRLAALERALAG